MTESTAWRDLSATAKVLYLACKMQYFGDKDKPDGNDLRFTMNRAKWLKYGLYKSGNAEGFYRDIEQLIMHGFVKCVSPGRVNRQKNVYEFSEKWQAFGTANFEICKGEMTDAMVKRISSSDSVSSKEAKKTT